MLMFKIKSVKSTLNMSFSVECFFFIYKSVFIYFFLFGIFYLFYLYIVVLECMQSLGSI